jgi:hypothetical protein
VRPGGWGDEEGQGFFPSEADRMTSFEAKAYEFIRALSAILFPCSLKLTIELQ